MINDSLRELISQYSDNEFINENSRLNSDLLINGEKALRFINAYSKEFNVDISNFDFNKYFNPADADEQNSFLTAGDLERAILFGSLDEKSMHPEEKDFAFRPRFTTKNIVLTIVFFIITTIFLGFIAFYF